jgi:predicted Zn-dependent protease
MPDETLRPHFRAEFLVGDGDAEAVWREARRAAARAPRFAPSLAVHLAYMGALDHAAVLARGLEPGAPRHRVYEAVVEWKRGDRAGALAALRRLAAENPWSTDVPILPPSFLLGELAVEAGEDATAVEALKRFQSLHVRNPYWGWAYPRSVLLLATAESRLGRRDEARRRLAAQLETWKDADPGLPLLARMKDLCQRLDCQAGGPPP